MNQRRRRRLTIGRDGVLFVAGLLLTINEGVFKKAERPSLLILYAAMMGLPAFIQADVKRRAAKRDDTGEIPKITKEG